MNENGDTIPTGNGYARIREVYDLLRESEDRTEQRLVGHLIALEKRLSAEIEASNTRTKALIDNHSETQDKRCANHIASINERWTEHLADYGTLKQHLATIEAEDEYAEAFKAGKLYGPQTFLKGWDFIESHWRTLALVLLALSLVLNFDLVVTLLGR